MRVQSAMEYLMTYGWSILIIAVVVAALFSLGVFSAGSGGGGNACIATSGYQCTKPLLSTTGVLSATIGEIGQAVTITQIACTNSTTNPQMQSLPSSVTLNSGQTANLSFSCPAAGLGAIGSKFAGYLWIGYTTQGSPSPIVIRVAQVKLTSTAIGTTTTTIPFAIETSGTAVGTYNGISNVESATVTLTTANKNDLIFAYVIGASSPAIQDGSSLSWSFRGSQGLYLPGTLYEYYAVAPSQLSSDKVTASFIGNNLLFLNVVVVSGASTSSPFDTHAGIPATGSGIPSGGLCSASASLTTSNANDMIVAAFGSPTSGYPIGRTGVAVVATAINGSGFLESGYAIESSAGSYGVTWSSGQGSGAWCGLIEDAVQKAP